MIDQEIAGAVLKDGRYSDLAAKLANDFSQDPGCGSFDTLLWLLNLIGRSPEVLELALQRPPELLTGETFFEVGIALYKCTQTELVLQLAMTWAGHSVEDYRPFALQSIGELQLGQVESARETAERSLALNPDQPYLRHAGATVEELLADRQENNLIWLTRLARVQEKGDDWTGLLDATGRMLELAPIDPVASRMRTTALLRLEGMGAAYEFSKRQFDACGWYEPFYSLHCKLCGRLLRLGQWWKASRAYSRSRHDIRQAGEKLVARFKPVAFVQSVTGWHEF